MENDVTNEFQGEFWNEFFRLFGERKPFVLNKFKKPDKLGTIRNHYRMICQWCGHEIPEDKKRKHALYHRECSKELCIERKSFIAENWPVFMLLCVLYLISKHLEKL